MVGSDETIEKILGQLEIIFTVTNLGKCSHYLGVKIEYRSDGIFLSQSAYIRKIIATAKLTTAKASKTPLPMSHPIYEKIVKQTKKEEKEMDNKLFRNVLGALLYLCTRTRPDIATAVSMLSKFQSNPSPQHWKMLKHVVRYLIGTENYGILLPKTGEGLKCWVDAD